MWKKYFKFIKLKPGRVVTALLGEIDFSRDDIPLEKIKMLYEKDFPYLELTKEGEKELYGSDKVIPSLKKKPNQRVKKHSSNL
jgi:hypothetical protein